MSIVYNPYKAIIVSSMSLITFDDWSGFKNLFIAL